MTGPGMPLADELADLRAVVQAMRVLLVDVLGMTDDMQAYKDLIVVFGQSAPPSRDNERFLTALKALVEEIDAARGRGEGLLIN